MIPRGTRSNGMDMAYWQRREAEGRERRRRPRSDAEEQENRYAAAADSRNGGASGASGDRDGNSGSGSGGGGSFAEGSEGNGQWEDEKEEVQTWAGVSVLLFACSLLSLRDTMIFPWSSPVLRPITTQEAFFIFRRLGRGAYLWCIAVAVALCFCGSSAAVVGREMISTRSVSSSQPTTAVPAQVLRTVQRA